MNANKHLKRAFKNAPVLPITPDTKYVFFSDCHRGVGNNNDNFLNNATNYYAALQYYYQSGFSYIEAGDGDELWENRSLYPIMEIHSDVFSQLHQFHRAGRLYMLYGNHDMIKKDLPPIWENFRFYEGVILKSENPHANLYVTHGHQIDPLNSAFWKLSRFLVRYLWAPLENIGVLNPASPAQNSSKKEKLEQKYKEYAQNADGHFLAGHLHRPVLGNDASPYHNPGSCVHPKYITCIELCGFHLSLVKWYSSAEKSRHAIVSAFWLKID